MLICGKIIRDMNSETTSQVILYSDPNFLALNILEKLLREGHLVNIVSNNKSLWEKKAFNFNNRSNIFITKPRNYIVLNNFKYAIFCGGFLNKDSAFIEFKKFIKNKNFKGTKTLAVFPLDLYDSLNQKLISVKPNSGILYVGDLLGKSIDLNSNLTLPKLINEMIHTRSLTLGVGELFAPLSVESASKYIVNEMTRSMFYGRSLFIVGKRVTSIEFWNENIKYFPKLKIIYNTKVKTRYFPSSKFIVLNSNFDDLLNNTYSWIVKKSPTPSDKLVNKLKPNNTIKPNSIKIPFRLRKFRPLLGIIIFFILLPFLTICISSAFLYISYSEFLNNKTISSQKFALISKTIFIVGKTESNIFAKIPIVNKVYKETLYINYLGENVSDIIVNSTPIVKVSESLLDNILGNEPYDIHTSSRQIKSSLDYLYQRLSYVQIETDEKSKNGVLSANQLLNIFDFDKAKNLVLQGSILINNLPVVLGGDENKVYLALFQNNMELRPTGGFIGSYGILNFGGGKLNSLTVNDIYSADGQLKGHIEPPAPIKDYLGEASWFLRDSNWNPDFGVSAVRAEWFLNKEVEQKVDGTIAIDLYPIKNILNYTGPIFLPDYNLTIDSNNLYKKTQQESEANFFAGSRKKASFLTALSRVLISEISKLNTKQKIGMLKAIYSGFESRSIQIHFNDPALQESIDKLSWNGGVPIYSCGNTCYFDFFGDVEANLGVNKSNYFITRNINLDVGINNDFITRNANIIINNSANQVLGAGGTYKTYLRILIPLDAKITNAKLITGQSSSNLKIDTSIVGERQEVGVYIEILPGTNKTINFSWESKIGNKKYGKYGLFVRKQAGTYNDDLSVSLNSKIPVGLTQPQATLTKQGIYTYNTNLSKDFFARVSFNK